MIPNTPSNNRVSLNELCLEKETKESINRIEGSQIFIIDGGLHMSRSIGNIENSSFGSNTNFQGDNVHQKNIQEHPDLKDALEDLATTINSINDEKDKDIANMHYETLIESIQQNKSNRIERCLKTLKDILGTVASLTTIAAQFAVVL